MPTLTEIADVLYAAPPDRFVSARNEYASRAKLAGKRDAAAAIAALRRPTVAAWLVNRLALRRGDLVQRWLELGESIRQAQTGLDGRAVRRLGGQRRGLLDELLSQIRELAGQTGHSAANQQPPEPVIQTLNAALSDAQVAAQLRAGRLLTTVSYAGFGQPLDPPAASADRPPAVGPPVPAEGPPLLVGRPPRTVPSPTVVDGALPSVEGHHDELRRHRARRALTAAQAAKDRAARNLEAVTAHLAEAQRRVDRAQRIFDETSQAEAQARQGLVDAGDIGGTGASF